MAAAAMARGDLGVGAVAATDWVAEVRAAVAREAEVVVVWARVGVRAVLVLGAKAAVAAVTAPDYQEKAAEEEREAGVRAAMAKAEVKATEERAADNASAGYACAGYACAQRKVSGALLGRACEQPAQWMPGRHPG